MNGSIESIYNPVMNSYLVEYLKKVNVTVRIDFFQEIKIFSLKSQIYF